ncbi:unnamed protein product [Sphagnum tenellum]
MTVVGQNEMKTTPERNGDCGNMTTMALDVNFAVMVDDDATTTTLDTSSTLMVDNDMTATTLDTSSGEMACRR